MTDDNPDRMLLYLDELLNDNDVRYHFTPAENWAYFKLFTYLWKKNGNIPENFEEFWKIFDQKTKKTAWRIWEKIRKKFVFSEGRISHKRVQLEMQAWREKRVKYQERAKKGADARWDKNAKSMLQASGRDACSILSNQNQVNINFGVASNNADEVLALDSKIAEKVKFLAEHLNRVFLPGKRSSQTFANIIGYFVRCTQLDPTKICWFTDAIQWAQIARVEGKKAGGKALFVAKVKQETGYGSAPRLLNNNKS